MPADVYINLQKLANQLQALRNKIGKPIHITSGYRCEEYNERVGGATRSQHLIGKAADIQVRSMQPSEVYDTIEEMIGKGDILQAGLKAYNTFTHYDYRGRRARW